MPPPSNDIEHRTIHFSDDPSNLTALHMFSSPRPLVALLRRCHQTNIDVRLRYVTVLLRQNQTNVASASRMPTVKFIYMVHLPSLTHLLV